MNITPFEIGYAGVDKKTVNRITEKLEAYDNNHVYDSEGYGRYLVILFESSRHLNEVFSFMDSNLLGYQTFRSEKKSNSCIGLVGKRNLSPKGSELVEKIVAELSR